ncbi:MAG: hypothetical protein CSA81_00195 [Acidobacteria bacterium]|nr:MAG: hypothetical protein CSA81_00195 [Acidobacteriota bacterium]
MKAFFLWIIFSSTAVLAQGQFTGPKETFLDLVDPLITEGEREIYSGITKYRERDYFHSIFWYKRDPHPELAGNEFKKEYFERREQARLRFSERDKPGVQTDRGRVFLLLGEPDEVVQEAVIESALGSGIKEKWIYKDENVTFSFLVEIGGTRYRLIDPLDKNVFEKLRQAKILDRAEPYKLNIMPISLPNIGATKDIENLVVKDREDLNAAISYSCFKSDSYQTEVYVGVTVNDGSGHHYEITLAAFDPYENKVLDIKKKVKAANGEFVGFPIALDPDQYQMVLRIKDPDGRMTVDRRYLDVPDFMEGSVQFSGIVWGNALKKIPVEGFNTDKRFIFADRFLDVQNQIKGQSPLYVMLETYGLETSSFVVLVNEKVVADQPLINMKISDGSRLLFEIPSSSWSDFFEIKVIGGNLDQKYAKSFYLLDGKPVTHAQMVASFEGLPYENELVWAAPQSDQIEQLTGIRIEVPDNLKVNEMYVYHNHRLISQRDKPPWQVEVSPGLVHLSGQNKFTIVMQTDSGPRYLEKAFKPLRIDQTIKTRAVNIFFNAFKEDTTFVPDLDLEAIDVKVDDKSVKPLSMKKEESAITYLFLVDCSYSMKDSFTGNIRAIKKFISLMRPIDQGFFVKFSNNYYQMNKPTRSKEVLKAVADSISLDAHNPRSSDRLYRENETYVYDAVIAGIHALIAYPGRKAAVLISDGISIEGVFTPMALLSYARENEVVIYSLWLDNNPKVSTDEFAFLRKEIGRGERVARAIGLSRFFAKKDTQKQIIMDKIKKGSITQGLMQMIAEESGGFHYRVFKADRSLIQTYIGDIENAMGSQYQMTLMLPISNQIQEVLLQYPDDKVYFRSKSAVKVRKTNPLVD